MRVTLHDAPNMLTWGLMMRVQSRLEGTDGFTSAAIQSLAQSTSSFEIRGNLYECAVNNIALASLLEKQGRLDAAVAEVERAQSVFDRLGARADQQQAATYLDALNRRLRALRAGNPPTANHQADQPSSEPQLASVLDGFTINRLVQAAVSRDLLLHEMASVAREQAKARGAIVVQVENERDARDKAAIVRVAASVGLDQSELKSSMCIP